MRLQSRAAVANHVVLALAADKAAESRSAEAPRREISAICFAAVCAPLQGALVARVDVYSVYSIYVHLFRTALLDNSYTHATNSEQQGATTTDSRIWRVRFVQTLQFPLGLYSEAKVCQ